ncbi:hypothetical protein KRP22_008057 [Phytophthora ramorum]|nr:Dual-specificity RNA pseudouridine synthase RluA [Phytophthora ramorum]
MGTKRKRDLSATDATPLEATTEIYQLIAAVLKTLQLPTDAFESTDDAETEVPTRIRSLSLDKLKRMPKLQPPGSVYSSDLALRLFFRCRKAGVATVHAKFASEKSEFSTVDTSRKLAALCVHALQSELNRRQYRHVVRVWLPEEGDVALGAKPDRILVQIREFAECNTSDTVNKALTAQLPLKILFRDDAIIVVEKPANVLSVDGTDPDAPVSVHRCIANVFPDARMVHRLDQETSGLLVVALTRSAAQSLNAQFRDRLVDKTYVARFSKPTPGNASTSDVVVAPPAADSAKALFKFGTPTFFGSGCPVDTVTVVPSTDGQAVSVLFSQFAARTSGADVTRDRKSCNLAVPVDVQSGVSIGIFRVDYRGNAFVPNQSGSYGQFDAEYYFAGQRGPVASEKYSPSTDRDLFISHEVGVSAVVWTPCGASTNFRVNSAITAVKKSGGKEDTQVAIDSVDSTVQAGFHYFISTRKCSSL